MYIYLGIYFNEYFQLGVGLEREEQGAWFRRGTKVVGKLNKNSLDG